MQSLKDGVLGWLAFGLGVKTEKVYDRSPQNSLPTKTLIM